MVDGCGLGADPPTEALYRMHSHLFGLRCEIPGVGALLDRFLAPFRVEPDRDHSTTPKYVLGSRPDGLVRLWLDGTEILPGTSLESVVDHLLWEVSRSGIDSAVDLLAVHAGAVSWGDAGAVLPGASGSGKSTMVAALVEAGCEYLSDEAALIDLGSGLIRPYPRALWMSETSIDLLGRLRERLPPELGASDRWERHVPPDALRPSAIGGSCELRCVIVPEHVPGAMTVLEPIRRSQAVLALMTNAFNFAEFKGAGLVALAAIAQHISAYRLRMGELSAAVDLVMEALAEVSDNGSLSETR
jgi:hypothetical protein